MTILEADSLQVRSADGADLIEDFELDVGGGETIIVCGPPGCGKTILLKSLQGLLDDRSDLTLSGTVRRNGTTGFLFQRPSTQLVRRVVRRDVAFGLENHGIAPETISARTERYAELLGAEDLLDREVRNLSGGETAKVALLGSLVTEPDLLLLDEPVASLDYPNTELMLDAIERLRETGTAVVIAEHDLRDLLAKADRVLLLDDGRIRAMGPPDDNLEILRSSGVTLPFATSVGLSLRDAGEEVEVPLSNESIDATSQ